MHRLASYDHKSRYSGIDKQVQEEHQNTTRAVEKQDFQKRHEGEMLFLTIIAIIIMGLFISGSASITAMVTHNNPENLETCHLNIGNGKEIMEKEHHADCKPTTIPD